ncbi:hypothetical protein RI367_008802 [Sorochytrium milnesiophthora]
MAPSASLDLQSLSLADRKHVLLVSTPSAGHVLPSIELSVQLIRLHGCRVSLLVSKVAADSATRRHLVPAQYAKLLTIVPCHDGLEPFDESVPDATKFPAMHAKFAGHYDKLARVIRTLNNLPGDKATQTDLEVCPLPNQRVDHIVVEMFTAKCVEHVRDLGLPVTGLWPCSASSTCALQESIDLSVELARQVAADPDFTPPPSSGRIGEGPLPPFLLDHFKTTADLIFSCKRVLLNTYDDLEPKKLAMLRALPLAAHTKLYTVGPLSLCGREPITSVPATTTSDAAQTETPVPSPIAQYALSWLDKQHAAGRPVVYISHGSGAQLGSEQVVQMAAALDKLKDRVSVVWAMRAAQQAHLPADVAAKFDVFNDAATHVARDSTVLVMGWAPQVDVLAHPATKAFLTHCGWNSTIEALSSAMPVIAWPMFAEQHSNATMIASPEVQIGVVIPGTSLVGGRLVPADEIVDAVSQVIGTDGKETVYHQNVRRLGRSAREAVTLGTGSSMKNLLDFFVEV